VCQYTFLAIRLATPYILQIRMATPDILKNKDGSAPYSQNSGWQCLIALGNTENVVSFSLSNNREYT